MKYFLHAVTALIATIKNLFQPAQTVSFPKVVRSRPERYRASFALTHDEHGEEACIACKKCQMVCPSDVIIVTAGDKKESPATGQKRGWLNDYTLDMTACLFCELCVQVCPTDAIVMTKTPAKPAFRREDLFLTMAQLYEQEPDITWGRATRLAEMQDPERGLEKDEPEPTEEPETAEAPETAVVAEEGS